RENGDLRGFLQPVRSHHADIHPGDWQDRSAAERRCCHRTGRTFGNMARQVGLEMRLDPDRAHAWPTAAMRDAEGLVQVHVADVGADISWAGQAYKRVEIGSVEINLAAMLVNDRADVLRALLEHAMRGRIGEHQGGEI